MDDRRGLLEYAHRANGKTRLALPLQDVQSVRALPAFGGAGHCFEVACAPHKLVLKVDEGEAQCLQWVERLERRVEHWKTKAEKECPPAAVPVFGARGSWSGGHTRWHLARGSKAFARAHGWAEDGEARVQRVW